MRIERYKGGRFFALYDDVDELIAVFVYRKGAEAVRARLEQRDGARLINGSFHGVDLSQSPAWKCPICQAPNIAPLGAEVVECDACGTHFEVDLTNLCPVATA